MFFEYTTKKKLFNFEIFFSLLLVKLQNVMIKKNNKNFIEIVFFYLSQKKSSS